MGQDQIPAVPPKISFYAVSYVPSYVSPVTQVLRLTYSAIRLSVRPHESILSMSEYRDPTTHGSLWNRCIKLLTLGQKFSANIYKSYSSTSFLICQVLFIKNIFDPKANHSHTEYYFNGAQLRFICAIILFF